MCFFFGEKNPHKLGATTLASIENSALLLSKQISFLKCGVEVEQSLEGIFCAQLKGFGQWSAPTKDSKHPGVFAEESSQVQLWPVLSGATSADTSFRQSSSQEEDRRKLHRIRTGPLHCLTSAAQKVPH